MKSKHVLDLWFVCFNQSVILELSLRHGTSEIIHVTAKVFSEWEKNKVNVIMITAASVSLKGHACAVRSNV